MSKNVYLDELAYLNLPHLTFQTKQSGNRIRRLFLSRGLKSSLGGMYSFKSHFSDTFVKLM